MAGGSVHAWSPVNLMRLMRPLIPLTPMLPMAPMPLRVATAAGMAIESLFEKFEHKHRRQILQAILRFHPGELFGVLPQLSGYLVDDKRGFRIRSKRIINPLKDLPLLLDLDDAEWNPGDHVIAVRQATFSKYFRQVGRISMKDFNSRVVLELGSEMSSQFVVQFEEQ